MKFNFWVKFSLAFNISQPHTKVLWCCHASFIIIWSIGRQKFSTKQYNAKSCVSNSTSSADFVCFEAYKQFNFESTHTNFGFFKACCGPWRNLADCYLSPDMTLGEFCSSFYQSIFDNDQSRITNIGTCFCGLNLIENQ